MKYSKLFLLIAIISALLGAIMVLPTRLRNESAMKEIEVVCDWQDIEVISLRLGISVEETLDELKQAGVSVIGVSDYDLKIFSNWGRCYQLSLIMIIHPFFVIFMSLIVL